MNVSEIRNRIAAIHAEVKGLDLNDPSVEDYARLKALDAEKKGLEADLERAADVERMRAEAKAYDERESAVATLPVASAVKPEAKSIGDQFFASPSRKVKGVSSVLDLDFKTLMTTTGNPAGVTYPNVGNQGVVVYQPTAPQTLFDVLETIPANPGTGYRFYAEVLYQNNADTVLEGGLYPESALRLQEMTAGIFKVATIIPATDEQLSDIPGASQYINSRIRDMVRSKAAAKGMSGSGVNDVLGIQNVTGTLAQAKGTDTVLDAVQKGFTKVNAIGGPEDMRAVVNLVIMNPYDWSTLRLAKDSTGKYLLGDPAAAGQLQVWGVPVITDITVAQGTALALDTRFFKILLGADLTVETTNSHVDNFAHGIQAIRAQIRMGMVPLRASAAVLITGLNG